MLKLHSPTLVIIQMSILVFYLRGCERTVLTPYLALAPHRPRLDGRYPELCIAVKRRPLFPVRR